MLRRFRRVWPLLFLLLVAQTWVQAEGLVTLTATPVAAETARTRAVAADDLALPELNGPAAGLQPVSLIEHYDALWLLATTPDGRQTWLRHGPDGWTVKAAPLASLRPELQRGGQAHVLALGADGSGQVT